MKLNAHLNTKAQRNGGTRHLPDAFLHAGKTGGAGKE